MLWVTESITEVSFSMIEIKPIQATGKWILAGEHAVLRGGRALVFPLQQRKMMLSGYISKPSVDGLKITTEGHFQSEIEALLRGVIAQAFNKLGLENNNFAGHLHLANELFFGVGLGASGSLCVTVTQLFAQLGYLDATNEVLLFNFARELENLFHGESSGVDVAVILKQKPISFSKARGAQELFLNPSFALTLSYTGKNGVTRECIDVVKHLWKRSPDEGLKIDQLMQKSVDLCQQGLVENQIDMLKDGIDLAYQAFSDWGLVDPLSLEHRQTLLNQGALSVKPTGSGLGGYMLALWPNDRQISMLNKDMILIS